MITVSGATEAQAGQTYCVVVAGFTGNISVNAEVDGTPVPVEITYVNGIAEVCFKVPDDSGGGFFSVSVVDSKGRANGIDRMIAK